MASQAKILQESLAFGTYSGWQTTGSATPTANALELACFTLSNGTIAGTPVVTGMGLNWVLVQFISDPGSSGHGLVYRAMGPSPSTGQLMISMSGVDTFGRAGLTLMETIGANTGGTNGSAAVLQCVSGTSPSTPTTLFAIPIIFSTGGAAVSFFSAYTAASNAAPRAGWTEYSEFSVAGGFVQEVQGIIGTDTSGSATWDVSGVDCIGQIVEILLGGGTVASIIRNPLYYQFR